MQHDSNDVGISRRNALHAVSGVAIGTALAGCSDGDTEPQEGINGNDNGNGNGTASSQVLNVTFPDDPENFDPHLTTINMAQRVLENVVEGLFRLNADLEPEPLLATDYEISDDETEYLISLKEGVQFHEPIGGEMTAADVVYTFERVMDPDVGSPRAENFTRVESVEAVDEYTVQFELEEPYAPMLTAFAESVEIIPEGAADEVDLQEHPIGTGPFSFVDWTINQGVEIEAFDDYHVDGIPNLEGVEFDIVPEPAARLTALEVGDTHLLESVPFQDIEDVSESSETEVATQTGLFNQGYWFNSDEAPFDDARVRRAVSHAIDRDAIIQGVLFGHGEPVHHPIPPASEWVNTIDPGPTPSQDIDHALELLDEAGVDPESVETSIKVSRTPGPGADAATLIQGHLSELGFDIEVVELDFSTWLDEVWVNNDYEMAIGSWSGRVDPDGWYYRQYHSEGAWNHWAYANDRVDELLEEGRTETDPDARADIYGEIESIVQEEVPMTFLYFDDESIGYRSGVDGYELEIANLTSFHNVTIDD